MHHTTNHVEALELHHIFILAKRNFFLFLLHVKYCATEKFNNLLPFSHLPGHLLVACEHTALAIPAPQYCQFNFFCELM